RPDVARKIAIPIVYLDPMTDANRAAIGFDLYSEANRRRAMEDAIRLRQPVMSSKVHLVQDRGEGEASGFLILMPVFQHVAGTRRIKGFVYSPFRAREFLSAANELSRVQNVEVALYDSAPKPENLLAVQELAGETGMTADRDIVIGNHKWVLRVSIKNTGALSVLSSVVLVLGILMGLLVTIIARLIIRRSNEDRRTVDLMTQQAAIRNSLTRELNHRVKNTLANVLSIVALTRRGATSIDDFAESLGARIRALSATHDLLSQTDWTDAPVEEIIRSELAPYMRDGDSHVDLSGPSVSLAPKDALSLGLAVHELATNAAKYGAFSVPGGMVSVRWKLLEPELAEIEWREAGGPPVVAPAKRGFGRDLIEKIVAHELRSQVDLRFNPEGVECTLQIPVRRRGDFALRAPVPVPAPMPASVSAPVQG
ncbi:MAG: CHASE domain-containing protein, partial [Novosphingobium sp.]|nr:CHASE domain-containing protein [Novosphingobium sp.]